MGRRDEVKGGMPTYNSTQAQISDTVSEGKKGGRNSYSTLPSSFLSFFCTMSHLPYSVSNSRLLRRPAFCVRERLVHPQSLFTFTTRTMSRLKFLPLLQAQPPFLATAILIYHPLLVQIEPAIRQTLILDRLWQCRRPLRASMKQTHAQHTHVHTVATWKKKEARMLHPV